METASALCRFLRDAAALLAWGGFAYLALAPEGLRRRLEDRLCGLYRLAAGLGVAATLASLPVQAATLGRGWVDALDPATLASLLLQTALGSAWMAQAGAAILLLLALIGPPRHGWRPPAATALLFLLTLTLSGHTVMQDGTTGLVHRAVEALHLVAAGFWLGALVPLIPTLAALDGPAHREAIAALRRFSRVGHAAVGIVIGTGVLNAVLVLGGWPSGIASPYRRLLAAKVALVALMAVLAVVNRYGFVPHLGRDPAGTTRRIRVATFAEVGLGLGAVALVAVFGQMEPT